MRPVNEADREALKRLNEELDAIEHGWPDRLPSGVKPKKLHFKYDPKRLPRGTIARIEEQCERLAAGLPGWEVSVDLHAWRGRDAGCRISIYINGVDAGFGLRYYNDEVPGGKGKKTYTPGLNACCATFPGHVDRLIAKFKGYPLETFTSKRYLDLCAERRRLNRIVHG